MFKDLFRKIIILILLIRICTKLSLSITKSKGDFYKSRNLVPLVVSISSEDKKEKTKNVDLICLLDIAHNGFQANKLSFIKDALKDLINLMDENDNFALVAFNSFDAKIEKLTPMNPENKTNMINKIENLKEEGSINTTKGLELGLKLLKNDYSSGDRVATMVLFSDGQDSKKTTNDFKKMLTYYNNDFTLYALGFGKGHDYELLSELVKIKDGSYFYIQRKNQLRDSLFKIYGTLSTTAEVNINLYVESTYLINETYFFEDLNEASYINSYNFKTKLIQVAYGKTYNFVFLLDIPQPIVGAKNVLTAKLVPIGLNQTYYWDEKDNDFAYEEYVRCIVSSTIIEAYKGKSSSIIETLNEGLNWLYNYYRGCRNWRLELNEVMNEYITFDKFAYLIWVSRIIELTKSKIGNFYYDNENTYTMNILDKSHSFDAWNLPMETVIEKKIISIEKNSNLYYFNLKQGFGKINNISFIGERTSFIYYSNNINDEIIIKSNSPSLQYNYFNYTKKMFEIFTDSYIPTKFISKNDFPIAFCTMVDGTRDFTFNIEFISLDLENKDERNDHDIRIYAYIIGDSSKSLSFDAIKINDKYPLFNSTYNNKLKIGKIVVKKDEIKKHLESSLNILQNYLYIIIKNNSSHTYSNIEGKVLFTSMDYIYSPIPDNYTLYSNFETGQNYPHLYLINMSLGLDIFVEFWTSGNELECRILNYKNYIKDRTDFFNDFDKYNILRNNYKNKTIIYVSSPSNIQNDNIIISIFSTYEGHIASNKKEGLSYTLKYINVDGDNVNLSELFNHLDNKINSNKTDNLNPSIIKDKQKLLLLGFAKFTYNKNLHFISFLTYFGSSNKIIDLNNMFFEAKIKYKNSLINDELEIVKCELINQYNTYQSKYNCSINIRDEEFENIELIVDSLNNENITITLGLFAKQYIHNLQNIKITDIFDGKNNIILENCTLSVDNNNNEFNLTGIISEKQNFSYKKINLIVALLSSKNKDKIIKVIPCNILETNSDTSIILNCIVKENTKANLDGAFSFLDNNNNLFVKIKEGENGNITFDGALDDSKNSGPGTITIKLETKWIIIIFIVEILIVLIGIGIAIYYCYKKINEDKKIENNSIINNSEIIIKN